MSDRVNGEGRSPRGRELVKVTQAILGVVVVVSTPLASFDARFLIPAFTCAAVWFLLDAVAHPESPLWRGHSRWGESLDVAGGAGRLVTAIRVEERSVRAECRRAADRLQRPR